MENTGKIPGLGCDVFRLESSCVLPVHQPPKNGAPRETEVCSGACLRHLALWSPVSIVHEVANQTKMEERFDLRLFFLLPFVIPKYLYSLMFRYKL